MGKTNGAFALETMFWIGVTMMLLWCVAFLSWKVLGLAEYGFVIWCYKLAFSGAIYTIAMPLLKYSMDMPVRNYHYPIMLLALIMGFHALAQLVRMKELDFVMISIDLALPPLILIGCLWLRGQEKKGSAAPQQT